MNQTGRGPRGPLNRQAGSVPCSRAEWAHSGDLFPLPHPQMGSLSALLDDWERRARKGLLFKTHTSDTALAVQDFCGLWMLTTSTSGHRRGPERLFSHLLRAACSSPTSDCCSGSFAAKSKILNTIPEQVLPPVLFKGVAIAS